MECRLLLSAALQMDGEADKFDKDQFEAEADRHFEAMKLPKWRLNKQDYPEVTRITCSGDRHAARCSRDTLYRHSRNSHVTTSWVWR